jgi:hypothetical protein
MRDKAPFDISLEDPYSVFLAEEEGSVCTLAQKTDVRWKF